MVWIFVAILMVAIEVPSWLFLPFVIAIILDFVFAFIGRR